MTNIIINGEERNLTEEELNNRPPSISLVDAKFKNIIEMRNKELQDTDWWVLRGNITDAQLEYRQNLRNIPQDYSETDYDDLLATDEQGNLTHTVWEKP